MHSVETYFEFLNLDLFLGQGYAVRSSLKIAGHWHRAAAPSQPRNHEGQQSIHVKPSCTQIAIAFRTQ